VSWHDARYVAMRAPPHVSGHIYAAGAAESGNVYMLPEPGGTLPYVDMRDQPALTGMGFAIVSGPKHRPYWYGYSVGGSDETEALSFVHRW